ncbi:N-acetylmuramoyl-L-alanine amidase [Salinicola avicenniae]|uniref:N-acetylmuramoyl-L-alanine amidase n=1 Tax=Salinicola avicenniae TaxID=2916836 RepID=UPI002073BEE5|nr:MULTISPECIES: N-acetylmuramoyl-L-alanine amidase [unclassified Salinicola]
MRALLAGWRRQALLALTALVAIVASASAQAVEVDNMRLWSAPDHVRLVFDMSGPVNANVFTLADPDRVVIDLDGTDLDFDIGQLDLDDSAIDQVRTGVRESGGLRVVLDVNRRVAPQSFTLAPNEQYSDRFVVDLNYPGESAVSDPIDPIEAMVRDQEMAAQRAQAEASATGQAPDPQEARVAAQPHPKRDIIVAVDAGHGGEDPGATGPSGTREKDVVLDIARKLKARFDQTPGFKAIMTRDGDYYVGLRQRTLIARQQKADFFVSIHADAVRSSQPYGSSVYALSQGGASSETARWLAATENESDLIGGVDGNLSLDDKDEVLRGVLLDLTMTATMNDSLATGGQVLDQLGRINKLHKSSVEQAGFVVLKSPDIPSLLVETGFISNPREEAQLRSSSHQAELAQAVYSGVVAHFRQHPPPTSLLAWQRDQGRGGASNEYRVQSGDTLSQVAASHDITMQALKQANGLDSDILRVGQVLTIP